MEAAWVKGGINEVVDEGYADWLAFPPQGRKNTMETRRGQVWQEKERLCSSCRRRRRKIGTIWGGQSEYDFELQKKTIHTVFKQSDHKPTDVFSLVRAVPVP